MNKRLALTKDGRLTYCTASEENIGKGRCNHISHQKPGESQDDFLNRINKIINNENNKNDKNNTGNKYKIFKVNKNKMDFIRLNNAKNPLGGAQNKFVNKNKIYKCDNYVEFMGGKQRNALSEEMTSLIEKNISENMNDFEFVEYRCCKINWNDGSDIASFSENFKKPGDNFKDLRSLLGEEFCKSLVKDDWDDKNLLSRRQKSLDALDNAIKERTGIDNFKEYCLKMISLDLITLNGDRAFNNMGIIYNRNDEKFRVAPCFDNGEGVLSYSLFDNIQTEKDFQYCDENEDLRICTFGVGRNKDYVDLIKKNGGPFLKINLKNLENDINNYKNPFYDGKIVDRNKRFLLHRLRKYRNILFEDIS